MTRPFPSKIQQSSRVRHCIRSGGAKRNESLRPLTRGLKIHIPFRRFGACSFVFWPPDYRLRRRLGPTLPGIRVSLGAEFGAMQSDLLAAIARRRRPPELEPVEWTWIAACESRPYSELAG